MKKPIIAVTGQLEMKDVGAFKIGLYSSTAFNCDSLIRHNAIPLTASFVSKEDALAIMEKADGLLMTGGADVDPARYGEETLSFCAATQPDRDNSDLNMFWAALELKKPILCICRGCQIGNVYFGGTLYQDIKEQTGSEIEHSDYYKYNTEDSHAIKIDENSPLHNLLGKSEIGINSLHHQAIKDLGKDVVPMAKAPDGIIEAWYLNSDSQWLRAYQWHPEMQDVNEHNVKIFDDFVAVCNK